MNNTIISPSEVAQTKINTHQPGFQWETPVLYTENWFETMTGPNKYPFEDSSFYESP